MVEGKKEIAWELIRETRNQKYFLVKRSEAEYFIFRTPSKSSEKSKNATTLANWEGEITPWGGVPVKIRALIARKEVKPDPRDQTILVPEE
ncbi:MAG: hypothetical protein Q8O75_03895 [bacterium]|nr:hypothetical protein [bacterium]